MILIDVKNHPNYELSLRPGYPDLSALPWDFPFSEWATRCDKIVDVTRGVSRHPVLFINMDGTVYALKELPIGVEEKEYLALTKLEKMRLPAVIPVGFVKSTNSNYRRGVLITKHLEYSIPYRALFHSSSLITYREHFLDAISSLLVQLHLAGVYWGDCSLSNTLFRRDAGTLQAYLVDAETLEFFPDYFPPTDRHQELDIMEENINGELSDMLSLNELLANVPLHDVGAYIRVRYQKLWEEITREDIVNPNEQYIIQERLQALNSLGYSVGEVELYPTQSGKQLRFRVVVTDRNYHRDQLLNLTGMEAEEMQARKMMNEILEIRALLSSSENRSIPVSVASYHWLKNIYEPTLQYLSALIGTDMNLTELYCQVLEHKWYMSEEAHRDVGHHAAAENYLRKYAPTNKNST